MVPDLTTARRWGHGLCVLAGHYSHAWLGVGCALDLDEDQHPGHWLAVVAVALAVGVGVWCGTPPVKIGCVLIGGCAAWGAAFLRHSVQVMIEWRGYTALAGVVLVAAALVPPAWLVPVGLVALVATMRRSWTCRSEIAFRRAAVEESPLKCLTIGQFGRALVEIGEFYAALFEFERVVRFGTADERRIAQAHIVEVVQHCAHARAVGR